MNVDFFVENVKSYCRVKGVSPSRACIESGAGKSLIDNVKRGRVPSVDSVQLLAQYLGVTVSDLLGETPPEEQTRATLTEHLAEEAKDRIAQEEKPTPVPESGLDPLSQRLNELLAQASDETKRAMIVLLEQSQRP